MSNAPPLARNSVMFAAALVCVSFIFFAEPVYSRVSSPIAHPVTSTLIIISALAAIAGMAWWQFVVSNKPMLLATPPISLAQLSMEPPYEEGKSVKLFIKLKNTEPGLRVRGQFQTLVGLLGNDHSPERRLKEERKYWELYETNAKSKTPMAFSCVVGTVMIPIDSPPLNQSAADHLNGPNGFIYIVGQLDYGSGTLDFCGYILSKEPFMGLLCVEHNGPVPKPVFHYGFTTPPS